MFKCPKCGSTAGVYTTVIAYQYYDFNGEPAGFDSQNAGNESKYARCITCNRRILLAKLIKEAKKE